MAVLYKLVSACVLDTTASMAGNGSVSGSAIHDGAYGRLVGMAILSSSLVAGSGVRVYHSSDYGSHWDAMEDLGTLSTCSGSMFSACLVGNAVKVTLQNGATDSASVRALFRLMPVW